MDEAKYELNIQSTARGLVQGERNSITQNFFDHTGRNWNTRLVLARDLRMESFKLGDTTAAYFPYVLYPVETVYLHATQSLAEASNKMDHAKRGILVLGESNAGKTRLALEALRSTLSDWPVLRWRPDYTKEDIPPPEFLGEKRIVLFLDDLQDYAFGQIRDPSSQVSVADPRTTTLRTLIETLIQAVQRLIVIATCRFENYAQTQTQLHWLFVQLTVVELPSFSANTKDPKSRQTIAEFQQHGTIHIEDWDGTLGSLVLGLSTKHSMYLSLPRYAATVLQSMKLLSLGFTAAHTERRLRAVCADVFGERSLRESEQAWREATDLLIQMQFVKEEVDESSWELVLAIRKDTYFTRVITDYPQQERNYLILRDLVQLRTVLRELGDALALLNLGFSFGVQGRFEEAIRTIDDALALDPQNAVAWHYKGAALGYLQRHQGETVTTIDVEHILARDFQTSDEDFLVTLAGQAVLAIRKAQAYARHVKTSNYYNDEPQHDKSHFQAYEVAVEALDHALALNPDNADTWLLKGVTLGFLQRYQESVVSFDHVLAIEPYDTQVWFLKAISLSSLQEYKEAIIALDHVLDLNPYNINAWYEKALCLRALKRFDEAISALDHVINIDPGNSYAPDLRKGISIEKQLYETRRITIQTQRKRSSSALDQDKK